MPAPFVGVLCTTSAERIRIKTLRYIPCVPDNTQDKTSSPMGENFRTGFAPQLCKARGANATKIIRMNGGFGKVSACRRIGRSFSVFNELSPLCRKKHLQKSRRRGLCYIVTRTCDTYLVRYRRCFVYTEHKNASMAVVFRPS